MAEKLLSVQDLHTSFFTDAGEVQAVNGVSFDLVTGAKFSASWVKAAPANP